MIRSWIVAGIVLAVMVVAIIADVVPSYYVGLLTEAIIVALFVMSLDLLAGFTGLESLGHAAFFGIGAYVSALMSLDGIENVFVLLIAAGVAATIFALVFGAIALRAIGPYFLIITMALGYLPWAWRSGCAASPAAMMAFPAYSGRCWRSTSGSTHTRLFLLCRFVFVLCATALAMIGNSAFGRSLRGIQDNPSRMETGYRIGCTNMPASSLPPSSPESPVLCMASTMASSVPTSEPVPLGEALVALISAAPEPSSDRALAP